MNLILAAGDSAMSDTLDILTGTAVRGLNVLGSLFLFVLGTLMAVIIILFIIDVSQTKDTVRRNYPVLGRFRSVFSKLGEFFRQYFFAMDREEMPFNRAQRDYINDVCDDCLLYTSPSPRDATLSRMPSSA